MPVTIMPRVSGAGMLHRHQAPHLGQVERGDHRRHDHEEQAVEDPQAPVPPVDLLQFVFEGAFDGRHAPPSIRSRARCPAGRGAVRLTGPFSAPGRAALRRIACGGAPFAAAGARCNVQRGGAPAARATLIGSPAAPRHREPAMEGPPVSAPLRFLARGERAVAARPRPAHDTSAAHAAGVAHRTSRRPTPPPRRPRPSVPRPPFVVRALGRAARDRSGQPDARDSPRASTRESSPCGCPTVRGRSTSTSASCSSRSPRRAGRGRVRAFVRERPRRPHELAGRRAGVPARAGDEGRRVQPKVTTPTGTVVTKWEAQ